MIIKFNSKKIEFEFNNPFIYPINLNIDLEKKSISNIENFIEKRNNYKLETINCYGHDGELIPCTLFMKKDIKKNRRNKCLQLVYGSYGLNLELNYNPIFQAAVDKGYIIAYSHVRGGYEKGEYWHQFGRLNYRNNSIEDFVSVSRQLIKEGYTHPNFIASYGTSAGATIVAQCANKYPEIYKACILNHPYLDVLSCLIDTKYRFYSTDTEEYGDVLNNKESYLNVMGWSPYENIGIKEYPAMLITMSLEDSRVSSYTTLKYIEKLRSKALTPKNAPEHISGLKNIMVQFESGGHFGSNDFNTSLKTNVNELAWADMMLYHMEEYI